MYIRYPPPVCLLILFSVKAEYREEKQNWNVSTGQFSSRFTFEFLFSFSIALLTQWSTPTVWIRSFSKVLQDRGGSSCWIQSESDWLNLLLFQTQQITPQLALQVLLQFDKAINTALANRVRNRVNFRVSARAVRTIQDYVARLHVIPRFTCVILLASHKTHFL